MGKGCLAVLLLLVALAVLGAAFRQMRGGSPPSAGPLPAGLPAGSKVVLDAGRAPVLIAASEQYLRRFEQMTRDKNESAAAQMLAEGKIFFTGRGTAAEVIRSGPEFTEMRLTGGDHSGRTGVTATGFLKPAP